MRLRAAIASLILLVSFPALAADEIPSVELGVGADIGKFNYKELSTPPDTESGQFTSLLADAKVHLPSMLSNLELRYENASFKSNYVGYNLNTLQGVTATDPLVLTDYEAVFNLALSDFVYVYVGYGHHVWNRDLAYGSGYTEIYSWDFIPVGMQAWYLKSPVVDAGIDLGFLPMLNAKVQMITSTTIHDGQDSTAPLGAKTGFKVKAPFVWHLSGAPSAFQITTTPWFAHTEIGYSNPIYNATLFSTSSNYGYEPSSETYEYGMEILLGVAF